MIGQQFVRLLADHPHFEITEIYGSSRSAGKKMKDIWQLSDFEIPTTVKDLVLQDLSVKEPKNTDIVFSGLPSKIAGPIEAKLRAEGLAVFSNAAAHRLDSDVPILIPEINAEHLALVEKQKETHNTEGFIVTNSNCSVSGAAIFLKELSKIVSIQTAVVTTYQALSGAGFNGVSALDINGNVLPFIKNEEEKIRVEGQKILGNRDKQTNEIMPAPMQIIANCARVNVTNGHLEAVTVFFDKNNANTVSVDRVIEKLKGLQSPLPLEKGYHIAPQKHLIVKEETDRPQPRFDVYAGNPTAARGMAVSVGRIRIHENTISAFVLVHNTIRGGAGGSVLNAEHAKIEGVI